MTVKTRSVKATIEQLSSSAIMLNAIENPQAQTQSCNSKFGGAPYAEEGDAWPECQQCADPMVFIGQFKESSALHCLFYCRDCAPWGTPDEEPGQWEIRSYPAPCNNKMQEISPEGGFSEDLHRFVKPATVEEIEVTTFPSYRTLAFANRRLYNHFNHADQPPWSAYYAAIREDFNEPEHIICEQEEMTGSAMIGGHPVWASSDETSNCNQCNNRNQVALQIFNCPSIHLTWSHEATLYLQRCPHHPNEFQLTVR